MGNSPLGLKNWNGICLFTWIRMDKEYNPLLNKYMPCCPKGGYFDCSPKQITDFLKMMQSPFLSGCTLLKCKPYEARYALRLVYLVVSLI
jgi:hypothetical protein